jgi:protocatechuate 3,4-dioxygenase alpha subunit
LRRRSARRGNIAYTFVVVHGPGRATAVRFSSTVSDNLVTPDVTGEKIHIEGTIFDGDGLPINDAMIEIWQADAQGRYAHSRDSRALPNTSFKGFGRTGTDADGVYTFDTIKPGAVPGPNGAMQAPHVMVAFYSRGLLTHL